MTDVLRRFEGRNFLVTGATRGIGAATAEQLIAEGARVVGTATSHEGAETLNSKGIVGVKLAIDQNTSAVDVRAFWDDVMIGGQVIDGVVLNAGTSGEGGGALFKSYDLEEMARIINVNTTVPLMIARCAFEGIMRKKGSVVMVGSIVGLVGHAGQVPYAASKGASVPAISSMAMEARKAQIRGAALGYIDTDMTSGYTEKQIAAFVGTTRLGRAATAKEAAMYMLNLATAEAVDEDGKAIPNGATTTFNVKPLSELVDQGE